MSKHNNGMDYDGMADLQPGDIIWLSSHEVFLTVVRLGPSLRRGSNQGPVIQRSAVVVIGAGSVGLPELQNDRELMLMITKDKPNEANIAPF